MRGFNRFKCLFFSPCVGYKCMDFAACVDKSTENDPWTTCECQLGRIMNEAEDEVTSCLLCTLQQVTAKMHHIQTLRKQTQSFSFSQYNVRYIHSMLYPVFITIVAASFKKCLKSFDGFDPKRFDKFFLKIAKNLMTRQC